MRRIGSSPFSFPEFRGATRTPGLRQPGAYFAFLLVQLMSADLAGESLRLARLRSRSRFCTAYLWQPFTYSFIHVGLLGTLFELLSLWFLAAFLSRCTARLDQRALCRLGAGNGAGRHGDLRVQRHRLATALPPVALYGCFGGILACWWPSACSTATRSFCCSSPSASRPATWRSSTR